VIQGRVDDGWCPVPWSRRFGDTARSGRAIQRRAQPLLQCREQELNGHFGFIERARLAGMLPPTTTNWLSPSRSWPNGLKTGWARLWVERSLANR
jgi:hypothetical protein